MMLFLTGVPSSNTKGEVHQNDPSKSLGGYVSSTPVPNGELNALFDVVSAYTKEKRRPETIGIALVNKTDSYVTNVTMSIVVGLKCVATFKVAAVSLNEDMAMEHIPNRYAEPMMAQFYTADFQRAWFDMKIHTPAKAGESYRLMGVDVVTERDGLEATCEAFIEAFETDDDWSCVRYDENTLRFTRRDETVYAESVSPEFVGEGTLVVTFTDIRNGLTNKVTLIDSETTLAPNEGIGLWIKRLIKARSEKTNEELLEEYKNKTQLPTEEDVEIVVNYDLMQ